MCVSVYMYACDLCAFSVCEVSLNAVMRCQGFWLCSSALYQVCWLCLCVHIHVCVCVHVCLGAFSVCEISLKAVSRKSLGE